MKRLIAATLLSISLVTISYAGDKPVPKDERMESAMKDYARQRIKAIDVQLKEVLERIKKTKDFQDYQQLLQERNRMQAIIGPQKED